MGGDKNSKTETATPKKRRDTRKKGQVRRSTDVNTTISLVIMFAVLFFMWEWFTGQMMNVFGEFFSVGYLTSASDGITMPEISSILQRMIMNLLGAVFPFLGAAMVAGVLANVVQIGFLFTTETLKFKFDKLNPVQGFKNMFSMRRLVEMIKNIAIVVVLGYLGYTLFTGMMEDFAGYVGLDIRASFIDIMQRAILMVLQMCIAMVFIALADFLYQHFRHERDIKMTKQEVKDEYKNTEGDPQIKGKIRQKQMQMSAMRMMQQVPEADVVITNPTHYAVVLKYDDSVSSAPVVVAKGQDYIALKIREVALEYGIMIVENPPLAQSLYALCDIDDMVPEELYQAVADVLVYVYRQKGRLPKAVRS